ncbi:MAG: FeS cluster assembly protein SufD [Fimbriimonadaceae bacterium]|nr:FeS cluster assembly protein SufD [Fimbriimonadaceae bacterium]
MASAIHQRTLTSITGFDFELGERKGFRELRERALRHHVELGIPTIKHEEWKYTSLRSVTDSVFAAPVEFAVDEQFVETLVFGDDPVRVVMVNGRFHEDLTSSLRHIDGLHVRLLDCALDQASDVLSEHFGKYASIDDHTFAALNTAGFEDMVLVHLEPGTKLERPLQLVWLTDASRPTVSMPRVLIVAEEGAEATILETHASVGAAKTLTLPVVEMAIAPNANIEHIKIQRENHQAIHIAQTAVRQAADSSLNSYSVTFGGSLTRNDLNVFLAGSNTHCRMDGIVILNGEQHADNHTRLDHAMPHCDSFEVYKHVLDDKSHGVFNGKIFVHQDAQKTDAKQTNQTILLSRTAEIDTKPQLEIYADDVKCTHGATVGQLREDALFYLRARGIPEGQARAMLVYAFAAEVLERISVASVRDGLEAILFEKLDR